MGPDTDSLLSSVLLGEAAENGPIALFLHDENGQLVAVNQAACALCGMTREELLQTEAHNLNVRPLEGKRLMHYIEREVTHGRTEIVCADGSRKLIEYCGGPTRAANLPYLLIAAWPVA